MSIIRKNDVVQFNENHKWNGCLGIVTKLTKTGRDTRYMIGVPAPECGTAYIYVNKSEGALERIGVAVMVEKESVNE